MNFEKNKQTLIFSIPNSSKKTIIHIVVILGIFLLPKIAYLSTITPDNIINLTNKERKKKNLPPLNKNNLLEIAAKNKASDIINTQKFEHNINNKSFSSWIKNTGYTYTYVGENLAIDFQTAEGVMKAWLESPTHKENILNSNFKEIGVAVLNENFGSKKATLVVQIFGKPINKYATIIKTKPQKTNKISHPIFKRNNTLFYLNLLFFLLTNFIFIQIFLQEKILLQKKAVV